MRRTVTTLLLWGLSCPARADDHVVRQGESLPQLAEQLYGDARRATILALANGLADVDVTLVAGERLRVPRPEYRLVGPDDGWDSLAQRLLGDERRAFLLCAANHSDPERRPVPGSEIVVPPVVSYRLQYGDGLPQVAERFTGMRDGARLIKRYNFMTSARINRGDVLLIPLPDLRLTAAGRSELDNGRVSRGDGSRAASQSQADPGIRSLDQMVRDGQYTEALMAGSRLLASESSLTGNQIVSIERAMGVAQVAIDRPDLAVVSFRVALRHQPDLEWNPITTSPKVLRVWQMARQQADPGGAAHAGRE
jgi:LysM domain-containing protein